MQALRSCDFYQMRAIGPTASYFMELPKLRRLFSILPTEKQVSPALWHGDNWNLDSMQGTNDLFKALSTDCQ